MHTKNKFKLPETFHLSQARPLNLDMSISYFTISLHRYIHHISIEKYVASHLNCLMIGNILHSQEPTRELSQGGISSQNLHQDRSRIFT